ncbi:FYVE zinc finger [Cooperia oncophora]
METVPDMDALLDELEEVVVGNTRKESKLRENNPNQAVVIELPVHLRKLSEKDSAIMETVPDMDALLDELEEVVVGNTRKESKLRENNPNQAVVIELPVHLRKLSEKETIKIELKPPDPALASLDGFSRTETIALPAKTKSSAYDDDSGKLSTLCTQPGNSHSHQKSISDDETRTGESETDTDFEEVLQYLNQFEDKVSDVSDVLDNEKSDAHAISSNEQNEEDHCLSTPDFANSSDTTTGTHLSVGPKQDNKFTEPYSETEENTQNSDDESLETTINAVAKAVVVAILDTVEARIEGTFSEVQGNENSEDQERRDSSEVVDSLSTSLVQPIECSSVKRFSEDNSVVDVEEDKEAPVRALSGESVVTGSTDSASFITVIHRPTKEHQIQALNEDSNQKMGEYHESNTPKFIRDDLEKATDVDAEVKKFQECQDASSRPVELPPREPVRDDISSVELPRRESSNEVLNEGDPNTFVNVKVEEYPVDEEVAQNSAHDFEHLSERAQVGNDFDYDSSEGSRSDRIPQGSSDGLETAIECETKEDGCPSPLGQRDRFGAQVISTIHDLSQDTDPTRLTESELQLGKSKPYWIPDDDCSMCMLCNSRFSLLNRRHHCRACGRVACGSCCKEKATLEYMKDDPKKQAQARVCTPCATMLARIEDYEKMMREHAEVSASNEAPISTSTSGGSRASRGVLKTRSASVGDSEAETSQSSDSSEKKRSVVFRDGVKPGSSSPCGVVDPAGSAEEKSSAVKPKKRGRKRHAVARRVAELRIEDELGCALPTATRPQLLVVCPNGEINMVEEEWVNNRLKEELPVKVVLKKNLSCVVKICKGLCIFLALSLFILSKRTQVPGLVYPEAAI